MRKLFVLFIGLFLFSCTKDDINTRPISIWLDEGVEDAIVGITSDGDLEHYQIGVLQSFTAHDVPGYRFVEWSKFPGYCDYAPTRDPEDFRTIYVFMGPKYMGNCNMGPTKLNLYPRYIKVF